VLFFALFRLLGRPHVPQLPLWQGALLGAVAFELLKQLSGVLLASTKEQPAFQAFGIALILLVWINYFSRVVLYSAAFAFTSPVAIAQRVLEPADPVQGPRTPTPGELRARRGRVRAAVAPFAAGGAVALGLVAWLRRREG
jgi:membrane protein